MHLGKGAISMKHSSSELRVIRTNNIRQGRFQDIFQGVAEISSAGGENLPEGGETKCTLPPSPRRFLLSYTTLLIYAQFLTFYSHCYKEIPKIFFFSTFSFGLLSIIQSLVSRNVLGSWGVGGRNPLKWSGGGDGGRATPLKPPLTSGRL